VKILLLASVFNGLTQRVWLDLRRSGHDVTVELALSPAAMREAAVLVDPDVIICPFLRERVPAAVWQHWPTVVVHPGPEGDRGPSALDWAIAEGRSEWGVTALSAVEEIDAGEVWSTRTFRMPAGIVRKSALYHGPLADAAVEVVRETVARVADVEFRPWPQDRVRDHREPRAQDRRELPGLDRRELRAQVRPELQAQVRPELQGRGRLMRQADRAFCWEDDAERVLRAVRAADGSPGVRTQLCGLTVRAFDAHLGVPSTPGAPGTVAARRHGAVLVRTGDGNGVWLGHLRAEHWDLGTPIKLPAASVLGEPALAGVPFELADDGRPTYPEIFYRRAGAVGTLTVDLYNGAMSATQGARVAAALRHAIAQDTQVLVLRGGGVFGNGISLTVIEAAADPAAESWRSIMAINEVCRLIITCTSQLMVAAVSGDASAGGAMLALGADQVLLRGGAVLNPHYLTMGLHGSEYWTYTLPKRVGPAEAERLTRECLPIGGPEAVSLGFADRSLAADVAEFDGEVAELAASLAGRDDLPQLLAAKRLQLEADIRRRPLEAYLAEELGEMSRDFFDDRLGYAAARAAFVTKRRPPETPARIASHRRTVPFPRAAFERLVGV
jgi:putative two-component system hydrogenase maturation factor HypX/HoxX